MKTNKKISILLILTLILSLVVPSYANVNIDFEGQATVKISGTSNHTQKPVTLIVYDRDEDVYEDQCLTDINGNYSFVITVNKGKQYTGKVKIKGEVEEFSFTTKGNKENGFGEKVKPIKDEILFFEDGIKVNLADLQVCDTSRVIVSKKNVDSNSELNKTGKTIEVVFKDINVDRLFEIGIPTDSNQNDKTSLYYYNSEEQWEYINSYKVNNLVLAKVTREGVYGVFTDEQAPNNVKVELKENNDKRVSLSLSAEDISGIKMFEIYRDSNLIGYSNSSRYIDTQISKDENYKYQIKAIDNLGNISKLSNDLDVKISKDSSDENTEKKVNVSIRIEGYDKQVLYDDDLEVGVFDLDPYLTMADLGEKPDAKKSNGWPKERFSEPTVAHAIIQAMKNEGLKANKDYTFEDYGWSCYISGIGKDNEFDYKDSSGWMYRVNGSLPGYGVQDYLLEDGDNLEVFFGVNGFMTWFTTISANKTTVVPEEEVVLTLKGDMTNLTSKNKRGQTCSRKISNAQIYVNNKKFKMKDKQVTTNNNGQAVVKFDKVGTYRIFADRINSDNLRDIVKPLPITIVVKNGSGSSSNSSGGGSNKNDTIKIINSSNAKETDIVNIVENEIKSLNSKVDKNKNNEDVENIIKDAQDVSEIIETAGAKVNTSLGAEKVAEGAIEIIKNISKISYGTKSDKVGNVVVKNMDTAMKMFNKIDNQKEIDSIADKILNVTKNFKDNTIKNKAIAIAEKVIEKSASQTINKKYVKVENNKAFVNINNDNIDSLCDKAITTAKDMTKKLISTGFKDNKSLEKKVTLKVEQAKVNEITADLKEGFLIQVDENNIDKVEVNTEIASFNIAKNTFTTNQKKEAIKLNVRKVNLNELSAKEKRKIDKGSIVLDLSAYVGKKIVTNFNEPIEISIPYVKEVNNNEKVTVFYLNNNGEAVPVGGVYDTISKTITFRTNHFSKYFAKEVSKTFVDMNTVKWAKEAVEVMSAKGIISGKDKYHFCPKDNITRAEFTALITRMLSITAKGKTVPFNDVKENKWYYDSIVRAYTDGLINGKSNSEFDPDGNITRQEMVKIVETILVNEGYKFANVEELKSFTDNDSIKNWAKSAVALAVREGIITGVNGKFLPNENATRAQAAVMIYKMYQLLY